MSLTDAELEDFLSRSASALRGARDDVAIRTFLIGFLRSGRRAGLSQGELIDYLAVSSPSVLDRANLDSTAQDRAMAILGELRDDELL